ncbi:hypothetical protein RJ640_000833 [Escallonia rubra]|uniref:Fe2OG dioxygenase domain-containing protein n=1 Tax=Escallonia rubra TaxID=112253 RepID=A0AA88RRM7_9ASTE|nr:hypothetical protein RJ640_000833 [Escallonia rubra]
MEMIEGGCCAEATPLAQDGPATIDVAKLRDELDKKGRAKELTTLATGAKEWGLFLIENHDIPDSVLYGVQEVVKGFFRLSLDEKKASLGSYMSKDNKEDGTNLFKTSYLVDRIALKAAPEEGIDIWPRKPSNFRHVVKEFVDEATRVRDELLQALAEALSLEQQAFLRNFEPGKENEVKVKANFYPACPSSNKVLGLPPHSDGSCLTLIMQFDDIGGLQVLKDENWTTVSWPPNKILVNFGDLMEIMSNGRLKSSWHRVVPQANEERISFALFYSPPSHTEIEPVTVRDEDDAADVGGYKKVAVGEYLHHLYTTRSAATTIKESIMFAKVM